MTYLTIIRGLPGSGKSTLAKVYKAGFGDMTMHLEADMFHLDFLGNYNWKPENVHASHVWCQEQTDELLGMNFHVIVSNTFTTIKELKPYFTLAKKYSIIPRVIHCQNNYGSIHGVPEETMQKMRARFQFDISELFKELHETATN